MFFIDYEDVRLFLNILFISLLIIISIGIIVPLIIIYRFNNAKKKMKEGIFTEYKRKKYFKIDSQDHK